MKTGQDPVISYLRKKIHEVDTKIGKEYQVLEDMVTDLSDPTVDCKIDASEDSMKGVIRKIVGLSNERYVLIGALKRVGKRRCIHGLFIPEE